MDVPNTCFICCRTVRSVSEDRAEWSRGHYSQQLLPVYYFLLFGGRRGHGGILLCIYHIITVGQALLWEQTIAIQHDYTSQISCSLQVTLSRGVASSKYIR